jgi:hypothetical protein
MQLKRIPASVSVTIPEEMADAPFSLGGSDETVTCVEIKPMADGRRSSGEAGIGFGAGMSGGPLAARLPARIDYRKRRGRMRSCRFPRTFCASTLGRRI